MFFTELENPKPLLLKPEETVLVPDQTPRFAMSRLFLEATLRRTPLPQSERGLALPDRFLLDPLTYQQRPAELALRGLRPSSPARGRGGAGQDAGDRADPRRADPARPGRPDPGSDPAAGAGAVPAGAVDPVRDPADPAGLGRHPADPAGDPGGPQPVHLLQADHHLDRHAQGRRVPAPPRQHALGRGRHRRVAQPHRGKQPPQQAGQAARPADRRPAAGQRHPAQRRTPSRSPS